VDKVALGVWWDFIVINNFCVFDYNNFLLFLILVVAVAAEW